MAVTQIKSWVPDGGGFVSDGDVREYGAIFVLVQFSIVYLQSHVTPTQIMMTQTSDDTPIIATRIITAHHTIITIIKLIFVIE